MNEKDYLVAGLGLCGAWLACFLEEAGCSVDLYDGEPESSASFVSGGIVNPVTGRRVVTTWLDAEIMPWLSTTLENYSKKANTSFMSEKPIMTFPASLQMQEAYEKRISEKNGYIKEDKHPANSASYFNYFFKPYAISPAYVVHAKAIIQYVQIKLKANSSWIAENMDESKLEITENGVLYQNTKYKKIIYASGLATLQSRYWKNLPFVPNKGQALIVDIPQLPADCMYKFGTLTLVPLQDGNWWAGSSNELKFEDESPHPAFLDEATRSLESVLKIPFNILKHIAAIRPATVDRRPFVGLHPKHPQLAILNGMGSKGCSLSTWFAFNLVQHLTQDKPIHPEADIKRFSRILLR